ncbi:MAG: TetR/AcrR family transcriptional regulator [Baekduiaceae bacterium]
MSVRDRNRERVRQEIGVAARRLFARQGYGATTIEQVADEAGVSVRTVFRHFPRKEDLPFHRHASIRQRFAELLDADDGARPSLDVLADALWRAIDVDGSEEDGGVTFLGMLEREPELRRHEQALFGEHHDVVAGFLRGRLAGGPEGHAHAELLAGAFMGTVTASRGLVLLFPGEPPRAQLERAVDLLRPLPWP